MTEKENYLRTLRGEEPEWVPVYSFGPMPGQERPCTSCMVEPLILSEFRFKGGGKDCWGVNYIPTYETGAMLFCRNRGISSWMISGTGEML